jgi:hypothetical protein
MGSRAEACASAANTAAEPLTVRYGSQLRSIDISAAE